MGDRQERDYRREVEDESMQGHENNLSLNVTNKNIIIVTYNFFRNFFVNPILISSNGSSFEIVVGSRLLGISTSQTTSHLV
jgi:hypothetical protein